MTAIKSTELARTLAEGIASGRHAVGSLLPTEFELCAQYGISRYGVRLALDELQAMGLISRRRNVGTRVEASKPSSGFVQSLASVEDLAQFAATRVKRVRGITQVVADIALAKELGCDAGTRWLRVSSVRMTTHKTKPMPVGWSDVYVDGKYSAIAALVKKSPEELISSLIQSKYGRQIARIQQSIEAVAIPKAVSAELEVEAGSPALKVVRRYLDSAGIVFEISVSLHPAGRFIFSSELRRSRDEHAGA